MSTVILNYLLFDFRSLKTLIVKQMPLNDVASYYNIINPKHCCNILFDESNRAPSIT